MTALVVLEHARARPTSSTVPSAAAAVGESGAGPRARRARSRCASSSKRCSSSPANDAAVALARARRRHRRPAFVATDERQGRGLGLTNTHFANPHGLDEPGHYTSAADLATLGTHRDGEPRLPAHRGDAERHAPVPGRPVTSRCRARTSCSARTRASRASRPAGPTRRATASSRPPSAAASSSFGGDPGHRQREGALHAEREAARLGVRALPADAARPRPGRRSARSRSPTTSTAIQWPRWPRRRSALVFDLGGDVQRRYELRASVSAPVTAGQVLGSVTVVQGDRVLAQVPVRGGGRCAGPGLLGAGGDLVHADVAIDVRTGVLVRGRTGDGDRLETEWMHDR